MELEEALLTRRTVNTYRRGAVPPEVIERGLEAAIRAPNHKLTNPWRFVWVGPQTRAQITELGVELKAVSKGLDVKKTARVREALEAPAELLIVTQVLSEDEARRREDYAAVSCAIQNLSLSLWGEGVGSKWSTGGLTRHAQVYAWCEINPHAEEIVGFVWIGWPEPGPTTPRLGRDEVVRRTP